MAEICVRVYPPANQWPVLSYCHRTTILALYCTQGEGRREEGGVWWTAGGERGESFHSQFAFIRGMHHIMIRIQHIQIRTHYILIRTQHMMIRTHHIR